MEAVLSGCPAFAISHDDFAPDDVSLAAAAAVVVARAILERGLEPAQLLNVNVPAIPLEQCAGIEVTRLGKRIYQDELIRRADPRGVPYYWVGGPPPTGQAIPGTDVHAVLNNRISITPIQLDLTADRFLERVGLRNPDSRSCHPGGIGRCGLSSTSLSAPSFDSSSALASMAATSTQRTSRSSSSAISSGCYSGRPAHRSCGPSTGSCSRRRVASY